MDDTPHPSLINFHYHYPFGGIEFNLRGYGFWAYLTDWVASWPGWHQDSLYSPCFPQISTEALLWYLALLSTKFGSIILSMITFRSCVMWFFFFLLNFMDTGKCCDNLICPIFRPFRSTSHKRLSDKCIHSWVSKRITKSGAAESCFSPASGVHSVETEWNKKLMRINFGLLIS